MDRTVGWDGFHNARDLGGLPTRAAVLATLGDLDVVGYLRDAGVADDDVAELRRRLLG